MTLFCYLVRKFVLVLEFCLCLNRVFVLLPVKLVCVLLLGVLCVVLYA